MSRNSPDRGPKSPHELGHRPRRGIASRLRQASGNAVPRQALVLRVARHDLGKISDSFRGCWRGRPHKARGTGN
ncbi:hypothetical protein U713_02570 [Rhodobacter capsulatus YW2]|nr:hypothetical protein U713_02570 [Rhodobacter capsulatus YW2]